MKLSTCLYIKEHIKNPVIIIFLYNEQPMNIQEKEFDYIREKTLQTKNNGRTGRNGAARRS